MYTIKTRFQRFRDIDLSELIGAVGVYIIWDAKAKARPTYIGEGNLLKRFADHCTRDGRRFNQPWDGYVAIISGSTVKVHKEEARAVERLLLDVAIETDRAPTVNVQPGAAAVVLRYCASEMLCVAVRGMDPLLPPWESRMFRGSKQIKAWADLDVGYEFDHDWSKRHTRRPIV
jgi:hypothetical protein